MASRQMRCIGLHRNLFSNQGISIMKTLSEIQSILRAHAAELHERFGISNLAMSGSVVRGEATEKSDVDILADIPLRLNLFD
jgi:predicted nucleotidyltransferase